MRNKLGIHWHSVRCTPHMRHHIVDTIGFRNHSRSQGHRSTRTDHSLESARRSSYRPKMTHILYEAFTPSKRHGDKFCKFYRHGKVCILHEIWLTRAFAFPRITVKERGRRTIRHAEGLTILDHKALPILETRTNHLNTTSTLLLCKRHTHRALRVHSLNKKNWILD